MISSHFVSHKSYAAELAAAREKLDIRRLSMPGFGRDAILHRDVSVRVLLLQELAGFDRDLAPVAIAARLPVEADLESSAGHRSAVRLDRSSYGRDLNLRVAQGFDARPL